MSSKLCETYSKILELVKDVELYSKEVEHDDLSIEEIHIVRDDHGKVVSVRAVTRYNSGY